MSSTKTDPGTPIFGELNQELELPNIEVQDFEPFGFDFSTGSAADRGETEETEETADAAASDSAAETDSAAQSSETSATESAARGGRRRKES